MGPYVLIPLIFSALFLLIDVVLFIRTVMLVKKYKEGTVEDLGKKIMPYMYATSIVSVLMAISIILVIVFR